MNGSKWARASLVLALCVALPALADARGVIELTRDLNEDTPPPHRKGAGAARPKAIGGQIFFAGRDVETGIELWRSDGTEDGTRLVADIRPGPSGSVPERFVDVGGVAYFTADDGVHGAELWRSDGTEAGTWMVRDIMPGREESDAWNLTELNGLLLFNADDGVAASELWRSDGTEAGTYLVKDIWPGPEHGGPQKFTRVGDVIYFVATDATHGKELWVTDGTTAGTRRVTDINRGSGDSIYCRRAQPIVELNGELFFSADDGEHGFELWKTDGTTAGTTMVRDVRPGAESSNALPLLGAGGYVYFNADEGELWVSDGSEAGTRRISEDVYNRRGMVAALGDQALYIANPGRRGTKGHQLWITDGTPGGARLLVDVLSPAGACQPRHFIRDLFTVGDRVYFAGRTSGGDEELWSTDGTPAGTQKVVDVVADGGCDPREFTALGDTVYYVADDKVAGAELWRSDGTAVGTHLVRDLFDSTDDFVVSGDLVPFQDEILFAGVAGLYRSDGTEQGTQRIFANTVAKNVLSRPAVIATPNFAVFWEEDGNDSVLWRIDAPGAEPVRVQTFPGAIDVGGVAFGDEVFFATKYERGGLLWRTNGTEVEQIFDFTVDGFNISERLFATSNLVFFTAADPDHSWELWRTDGTPEGTFLTRDNNRFGPGLDFEHVDPAGELLFFTGNDGMNGWEMWRSDGTEAGTFMLEDIAPGSASGISFVDERAATASGRLFFLRERNSDEQGNRLPDQLWTSDGTEAGTRLVIEIPERGRSGAGIFVVGEIAYFTRSHRFGAMLWRTDGTRIGTRPVMQEPRVADFFATDRAIYFTTSYRSGPGFDDALWASDGTSTGTKRFARMEGDFLELQPQTIVDANGKLFLLADDGVHGFEVAAASCGNGRIEGDEQCDAGDGNGRGTCSVHCERATRSNGERVFAPLKRRGASTPPTTRRLVGGRTGRTFLPAR